MNDVRDMLSVGGIVVVRDCFGRVEVVGKEVAGKWVWRQMGLQ